MAKRKGKPQGIVVKSTPQATTNASSQKASTKKDEDSGGGIPARDLSEQAVSVGGTSLPANDGAAASAQTGCRKKKRRRTGPAPKPVAENISATEGLEDEEECVDEQEVPVATPYPATVAASSTARLGSSVTSSSSSTAPAFDLQNGSQRSRDDILAWFLWPLSPSTFFSEFWEKKPLHLKRQTDAFYGDLFSKEALDEHLRADPGLMFGKHINLVRYDATRGGKIALSPARPPPDGPAPPRADPAEVEKAWKTGASIQAMHPQQYHKAAWGLLSSLESAFGALFGANAYLTPASSQGLAPHFDDVEVFMLQLEGKKHWRLHAPPAGEEYPLPRDYSRDFSSSELGDLLLECTLHPGDLLYLPRGTVHYGITSDDSTFSHHLTVSTYQKTCWSQVMEKILVSALEKAASSSLEFRAGLPVNFLNFMGTWHDNSAASVGELATQRGAFTRKFKTLMRSLEAFADLDEVCDELGVDFSAQRLPPRSPEASEQARKDGSSEAVAPTITVDSHVRWVDPSAIRLVLTTDPETSEPTVVLFHSCTNDRLLHMCRNVEVDEDVGCLRFEAATFLPALRSLHAAGHGVVRCGDLPLPDDDDRIMLCENLVEAGVLQLTSGI